MFDRTYLNAVEDAIAKRANARAMLRTLVGRSGLDTSLVLDDEPLRASVHLIVEAASQDRQSFADLLAQAEVLFKNIKLPAEPTSLDADVGAGGSSVAEVDLALAGIADELRTSPTIAVFEVDRLYLWAAKAQLALDHSEGGGALRAAVHRSAVGRLSELVDRVVENLHHLRLVTELLETEDTTNLVAGATEADHTAAQLMRRREVTAARTQISQSLSRARHVVERIRDLEAGA